MAPTVTRLILSFALVVATPTLFFMLLFLSLEVFDRYVYGAFWEEFFFIAVSGISVAFFGVGWWLTWMGEVKWNARRTGLTAGVLLSGLLGWSVVAAIFAAVMPYEGLEIGVVFGGLSWMVWWLFGTAFAWRETKSERGSRLASIGLQGLPCPSCGYNLSGLRESKCPECGAAFTLDQLYAAVDEQRRPMVGA